MGTLTRNNNNALKVLNPRGSYPYISHCYTHAILDFITVK